MTTAQLKAKYQLAQMNHQSQATDQTKDELAAAKEAYDAALKAEKTAKPAAKDADKGTGTAQGTKTDSGEGDDAQKKTE